MWSFNSAIHNLPWVPEHRIWRYQEKLAGKNQSIALWTSYGHCSKVARHLMLLAKKTDNFQRDRINLGGLPATCQQLASNSHSSALQGFLILINPSYHTYRKCIYIYSHPKINGQVNHHWISRTLCFHLFGYDSLCLSVSLYIHLLYTHKYLVTQRKNYKKTNHHLHRAILPARWETFPMVP